MSLKGFFSWSFSSSLHIAVPFAHMGIVLHLFHTGLFSYRVEDHILFPFISVAVIPHFCTCIFYRTFSWDIGPKLCLGFSVATFPYLSQQLLIHSSIFIFYHNVNSIEKQLIISILLEVKSGPVLISSWEKDAEEMNWSQAAVVKEVSISLVARNNCDNNMFLGWLTNWFWE